MDLHLRPIQPEDEAFLLHLCGTTRTRELDGTDLTAAERAAFIRQQFQAQTAYYLRHYPRADFLVILHEGAPIGRISVDRRPAEIRLMDIALLPEWRNRGLGGRLTRNLQEEARRAGQKVTLYVEVNNPDALRFYQRLGFTGVEDIQTHLFMSWSPE